MAAQVTRSSYVHASPIETLESRWMLSASYNASTQALIVNGSAGNDAITLSNRSGWLSVVENGVTTFANWASRVRSITVNGNAGNDTLKAHTLTQTAWIYGGSGNDNLYGGLAADGLVGGDGNDTLVSIDSAANDYLYGQGGYDAFWCDRAYYSDWIADADYYENSASVHYVASFANGADRTLTGDNLADPTDAGTKANFSSRPLFASDGAIKDDIFQGSAGDCAFLSTLSSIARVNPNRIRQSVVDLGDGTYAVQFFRNGVQTFVRVDGELSVNSSGGLVFAKLGHQNSLWVSIMEKAWAFFRTGANTYASTNSGFMNEAFKALGTSSTDLWSSANGTSLLNYIQSQLSAGKAVTYAVNKAPAGSSAIKEHAYSVERVNFGWSWNGSSWVWAPVSLTLRNPWGYDGAGNDGNTRDGYITLTAAQAQSAFWTVQSASV